MESGEMLLFQWRLERLSVLQCSQFPALLATCGLMQRLLVPSGSNSRMKAGKRGSRDQPVDVIPVHCLLTFCDWNGSHIGHTIVFWGMADLNVTLAQMVFAPEDIGALVSASWDL